LKEPDLRKLLQQVADGEVPTEEAVARLRSGPFRNGTTESVSPDYHRRLRLGMSEVVYGEFKTTEQILTIVEKLAADEETPILVTRLDEERLTALGSAFPDGRSNPAARTYMVNPPQPGKRSADEPYVAIVSAGTSDFRIVEEAAEVCLASGVAYERVGDVGVAGLHRMLDKLPVLQEAAAIVVIAGMDGVLPSVVGGMVGRPVIGVPTSIGYGASFGGIAALLTMLNSCAPGVTVTNIDSGFSAAVAACRIVRGLAESKGK